MRVTLTDEKGNLLGFWYLPDEQVDCGGDPVRIAEHVVRTRGYAENDDEKS